MEAVQKAAGCFRFGQATAMFLIEGIGNILDLLEQVLLALSQEQEPDVDRNLLTRALESAPTDATLMTA